MLLLPAAEPSCATPTRTAFTAIECHSATAGLAASSPALARSPFGMWLLTAKNRLNYPALHYRRCLARHRARVGRFSARKILRLDQPVIDCEQRELQAAGNAKLVKDVGEMVFHRIFA